MAGRFARHSSLHCLADFCCASAVSGSASAKAVAQARPMNRICMVSSLSSFTIDQSSRMTRHCPYFPTESSTHFLVKLDLAAPASLRSMAYASQVDFASRWQRVMKLLNAAPASFFSLACALQDGVVFCAEAPYAKGETSSERRVPMTMRFMCVPLRQKSALGGRVRSARGDGQGLCHGSSPAGVERPCGSTHHETPEQIVRWTARVTNRNSPMR